MLFLNVLKFDDINKVLDKKELGKLIDKAYRKGTEKDTVLLADAIMRLGYPTQRKQVFQLTLKIWTIPEEKVEFLKKLMMKLIKLLKNITKVLLPTVNDTTRSLTFGHKQTKNFQKL